MERRRPTGILIIAILMIIIGIGSLILGIAALSFGLLLSSSDQDLPGGLAPGIIASGGFTLALGIATLVISWGLLKAKGWAWLLTVIIAIISIINSIAALFVGSIPHIIMIIIYGAILYYLFRPDVKSYFGRAQEIQK
jgi:hypothetical protein